MPFAVAKRSANRWKPTPPSGNASISTRVWTPMFNVMINAPGRDPRSVQCMHRECGIGRDDANLVMLQGWSIASKHASLVREDDGIYIMSLGGKAPITINGTQVISR